MIPDSPWGVGISEDQSHVPGNEPQLSINGVDLPHTLLREGDKLLLKVSIPGKMMRGANGRLRVGFDAGVTHCPADLFPGSPDRRVLGLALTGIQLKKAYFF